MIEDPHTPRAIEEIMIAIEDVHGQAAVKDAMHRGSVMTDQLVFDLAAHLIESAVRDEPHPSPSVDPDITPSSIGDVGRALSTVLFTDMVASTAHAAELGDRAWRDVLDEHDRSSTAAVRDHHGQLVKHTGDGIMATFDRPALAILCAQALTDRLASAGIVIRAGIHTGEVEVRGSDIGGIAVHIAARIAAAASPREILVSHTVKDLVAGADVDFHPRGPHQLKGVPDTWELFAATDTER